MTKVKRNVPAKTEIAAVPPRPSQWPMMEGLRREVDRLFDDFRPLTWGLAGRRPAFDLDFQGSASESWQIAPAMNVVEKEGAYEISAELPGLDDKNVEVKLSNGMLTIKGEKAEEKDEREGEYYLSERRYGSFQRSFSIPDGIDRDKIEAAFTKGVLKVTLPKTTQAQRAEKKISVKAG